MHAMSGMGSGNTYDDRLKEMQLLFSNVELDNDINVCEVISDAKEVLGWYRFTQSFLSSVFGVDQKRISEFLNGHRTKNTIKLANQFAALKDEQTLEKLKQLWIDRPGKSPNPRRRSRSVPRKAQVNLPLNESPMVSSFGLDWPFDYFIEPGSIKLVARAPNINDPILPPVSMATLMQLAGIHGPHRKDVLEGIVRIVAFESKNKSTNPFFDYLDLAGANPANLAVTNPFLMVHQAETNPHSNLAVTNPFLMINKAEPNGKQAQAIAAEPHSNPYLKVNEAVTNADERRAVTPDADVMPPNYSVSTISRIQKTRSKLPSRKK